MSAGKVDVVAVLAEARETAVGEGFDRDLPGIDAAMAAFAELIEAAKDAADYAGRYAELCDDPDGPAEKAWQRVCAALARVQP